MVTLFLIASILVGFPKTNWPDPHYEADHGEFTDLSTETSLTLESEVKVFVIRSELT